MTLLSISVRSDLSYNPENHQRTKHVERRHFFIRDMVENFEITMPFVETANNSADMMTKCLKPAHFRFLRNKLMGLGEDVP